MDTHRLAHECVKELEREGIGGHLFLLGILTLAAGMEPCALLPVVGITLILSRSLGSGILFHKALVFGVRWIFVILMLVSYTIAATALFGDGGDPSWKEKLLLTAIAGSVGSVFLFGVICTSKLQELLAQLPCNENARRHSCRQANTVALIVVTVLAAGVVTSIRVAGNTLTYYVAAYAAAIIGIVVLLAMDGLFVSSALRKFPNLPPPRHSVEEFDAILRAHFPQIYK